MSRAEGLLAAAARFGVVVLDESAHGFAVLTDAVRNEIAREIAALEELLRTLRMLGRELFELEELPEDLSNMAVQFGVTTAEELERAALIELAELQSLDREVEAFSADEKTGK